MNTNKQNLKKILLTLLRPLPNILTLSRIGLTIYCGYLINSEASFEAFIWIVVAGLTDYCDGKLATLLKAETNFGKVVDPIADKLQLLLLYLFSPVAATLVCLFEIGSIIFSSQVRKIYKSHYISPISKQITATQFILLPLLFLNVLPGVLLSLFVFLSYTRCITYMQEFREEKGKSLSVVRINQ